MKYSKKMFITPSMTMKFFLCCFMLLFYSFSVKSQKFNFGVNANIWILNAQAPNNIGTKERPDYQIEEIKTNSINFQANVGFDLPVLKIKDQMSIGFNLNTAVGYLINPQYEGLNGMVTLDIPQYLCFRYGMRSTKKNENPFGFGVGLGYQYEIIPFPLGTPSAFIDFSFSEEWFVKLSFDIQRRVLYNYFSSEGLVPSFQFREIGLQLGFFM